MGRSWAQGALSVGAAYYGQWKVTHDSSEDFPDLPFDEPLIDKHRVFGLGPDVTIPMASGGNLIALINVRYQWEFGAQTTTQGQGLNFW